MLMTRRKVLTITLNPAIDIATELETLLPGRKLRCDEPRFDPGGGGINVARTITKLGGDVRAFVVAGGSSGAMLRDLCEAEHLDTVWFDIEGRTRELLKVSERESGNIYRFVLPGPPVRDREQAEIIERVAEMSGNFEYVVASGSLAPNMPDDFHARLAARVRAVGARFVVDTSGDALKQAVEAGLYMIKPDMHEAAELAGRDLADSEHDQEALVQQLLDKGTEIAIVTLGANGAFAGDRNGKRVRMRPPRVEERNPVGAGDAFLGAAIYALSEGEPLEDAVRLAVAAAAATVQTLGTQTASREEIVALRDRISDK